MTATNAGDEHAGRIDAESDRSSLERLDVQSNADLYATPPVYTMSIANGEESLNAEAYQPEKTPRSDTATAPSGGSNLRPVHTNNSHVLTEAGPSNEAHLPPPSDLPPDYFTELTNNAAAVHMKRCSLLEERPATWLVKRKKMALCALVATVLIKEGLVREKDLELVSRSSGAKRDPTDPLSAVAFGVYDTVGDILLGLVEGPAELGRQVAPTMQKYVANQYHNDGDSQVHQQRPGRPSAIGENTDGDVQINLHPEDAYNTETASIQSTNSRSKEKSSTTSASNAAKQVAIGTGKGLGKIVGAGFKMPMTFSHGLTRGFHNVPKLYGEEVREYENVTDLRSGMVVSGKGFAYGVSDGLKDLFVKPIEGAQREGVLGFGKGFAKGIGNLATKPAAGLVGLVGYSSMGAYKSIRGINFGRTDAAVDVVMNMGEAEYKLASDGVRLDIVKRWCKYTMRQ